MNRRNLLAAGASALAGFFIGGKLPQLAASDLDIDTIKRAAGTYAAYTIPNCKIPDSIIVGDPVVIPKPTITNSVIRVIKDAGSTDKKIAMEAGRLIADALKYPLHQEIVTRGEMKIMHMDVDIASRLGSLGDQIEYIYMDNKIARTHTHHFACDIQLKYMRDSRIDIFGRMCTVLVDNIVNTLNKPNMYLINTIDVLYDESMHDLGRFGLIVAIKTVV